ncbi:hypothetical protein DM860_000291 [Cuscuta australis]|uniref:Uncharacterized protein n=1 Tax=Cuscuta australis TaxID=267555 RepID=A0A328CW18_9ASTE|nr:hypothetical protein DM860_000291 [Cuscuta australis]
MQKSLLYLDMATKIESLCYFRLQIDCKSSIQMGGSGNIAGNRDGGKIPAKSRGKVRKIRRRGERGERERRRCVERKKDGERGARK